MASIPHGDGQLDIGLQQGEKMLDCFFNMVLAKIKEYKMGRQIKVSFILREGKNWAGQTTYFPVWCRNTLYGFCCPIPALYCILYKTLKGRF